MGGKTFSTLIEDFAMRFALLLAALLPLMMTAALAAAENSEKKSESAPLYELRIYRAAPGKMAALHARFRDHACRLLEKHGIKSIGYWEPLEETDHRLIYLLEFPSRTAREASWKAFAADPEWQTAKSASEQDGKLVAEAESYLMEATDYSPQLKVESRGNRIFNLRTYITPPGRLAALHDRFRKHTCELFAKHGMTNLVYFQLLADQPQADVKLVYLLAHDSAAAVDKSFADFRADPKWIAVRTASEEQADGSLTADGGVETLLLKPADYSPLK